MAVLFKWSKEKIRTSFLRRNRPKTYRVRVKVTTLQETSRVSIKWILRQQDCTILNTTNSIQNTPPRESDNSSASQISFCPLWNPKVYYLIHNSPPLILILSQMNQFTPYSFQKLSSHIRLGLPSGLFNSALQNKTLRVFISHKLVTHAAHLALPDFFILIIPGEVKICKLRTSLTCKFLARPVIPRPRSKYSPQHPVL
jgi:hypothetical protein